MRIAFFASSLVSAYWNGAATYYRGLVRALAERAHRITVYEPDAFDRQSHRDIDEPSWARVRAYRSLGARACVPIYNALDPLTHHPVRAEGRLAADLAFLGNRLPDREARVRSFFLDAAACGTPVISDAWPGLETFFEPGQEILLAHSAEETLAIVRDQDDERERRRIGAAARARVLREHTAAHRAATLESYLA